jgi:hypothetical protein
MTTNNTAIVALLVLLMLMAVGCKAQKPVLYPNDYFESVGADVAQTDINECIAKAEAAGVGPERGDAGKNVATSAAVAGAAGAVFGAIMGYDDVARRAAASAGAGAAGAAIYEGTKSGAPDSMHKQFVNKCLAKKGYEILGWK